MRRKHYIFYGLMILVIVALTLYFFHPKKTTTFPHSVCDSLEKICVSTLGSGESVSLFIEETLLPTMVPLSVQVSLENISATRLSMRFWTKDRDTPENHIVLFSGENGSFYGKTSVPAFKMGQTPWETEIFIETGSGIFIVPFSFSIKNNTDPLLTGSLGYQR